MTEEPVDRNSSANDDKDGPKKVEPPHAADVAEAGPTFAASEPHVHDLSAEIAQALVKSPGERVTCRRISGSHYRCNWWSAQGTDEYDNPKMHALMVTTHRVSKSQMLHVTKTAKGLSMVPVGVGNG